MTKRTQPTAAARRKPKQQRFKISVEGQEMLVEYEPDWMEGTAQFQFRSPHKPARRIPVSETGYRSHFACMEDIEDAESPQAYARLYALSVIRRVPPETLRAAKALQPSLLSLID
jgi:hypothetical protein